ncbi:MAG: hypothetical protein LBE61_00245 [Burkholderiaceae bacterium]|jgi:hypothetical protein|nr:hypothetical protein [Burkholderiaceae bacterium]
MPDKPTPKQQLAAAADVIREMLRRASHHLPTELGREAEECEEACRRAADSMA